VNDIGGKYGDEYDGKYGGKYGCSYLKYVQRIMSNVVVKQKSF